MTSGDGACVPFPVGGQVFNLDEQNMVKVKNSTKLVQTN